MAIETQLLIDNTIASVWDALPADAQTPESVENHVLQHVRGRLAAFKENPKAFRPSASVDKSEIKRRFAKAYAPWSDEETSRLGDRYRAGASVATLVQEFERSRGAVVRRLERLGLIEPR